MRLIECCATPRRSKKNKLMTFDGRCLVLGSACLVLAGFFIFEAYYVSLDQSKRKPDQKKTASSSSKQDPAFVCLNETDPLYYVSTYNKLACESLIQLAYKIFLERDPTPKELDSWMMKCTSAKFDPASLSWQFSQLDEHFSLVKRKREFYGHNHESRRRTTVPSTTQATNQVTEPAVICLTSTPSLQTTLTMTTPTPPQLTITPSSTSIEEPDANNITTATMQVPTVVSITESTEDSDETFAPLHQSFTELATGTFPSINDVVTTMKEESLTLTSPSPITPQDFATVTPAYTETSSITTMTPETTDDDQRNDTDQLINEPITATTTMTTTVSPNFTVPATTASSVTSNSSAVPLQMKLKKQEFKEELDNPESDAYKQLSNGFQQTMSEMLGDLPGFKEVRVLGFKNGSLVVIYEVVFDNQQAVNNITDDERERNVPDSNKDESELGQSNTKSETLDFTVVAKEKVKNAIVTMLNDPAKKTKVLNNSVLVEEDFDFETVDIAPKEVVETLKIKPKLTENIENKNKKNKSVGVHEPDKAEVTEATETINEIRNITEKRLEPYQVVFMKLRVTNMNFTRNLTDRNNKDFRRLEKKFIKLLNPLLLSLDNYAGMEVMGFSTGSLIANNELYFRHEVPVNISKQVKDRINAAATYFHYLDINVDENATQILQPGEADLCEFVTCSIHSECVERSRYRAECVCRPGYIQINPNVCVSSCDLDPDYCKNGGQCEVTETDGAKCRCKVSFNWAYTGDRCENLVSTAVVIMSATSALVLLISILAVFAICYYAITGTDEEEKKNNRRLDVLTPQTGGASLPTVTDATNAYSYVNRRSTPSTNGTFTTVSSFRQDSSVEHHQHQQCHLSHQQEVVVQQQGSSCRNINTTTPPPHRVPPSIRSINKQESVLTDTTSLKQFRKASTQLATSDTDEKHENSF